MTGYQRKYLRGLAHPLKPVVQVGQGGVTEGVLTAVEAALLDHELIKVRLLKPDDKRTTASELATGSAAELCGLVGHTVILYKPHPEDPVISIPVREK